MLHVYSIYKCFTWVDTSVVGLVPSCTGSGSCEEHGDMSVVVHRFLVDRLKTIVFTRKFVCTLNYIENF